MQKFTFVAITTQSYSSRFYPGVRLKTIKIWTHGSVLVLKDTIEAE